MPEENISRLSLDLWRVLASLLETRNATHTARALGLGQPAVSKALRRLRATFGDPLFVRHARGLSPTPRALALVAPLGVALASFDALVTSERFDPSRAETAFVIAASDYGQTCYLVPVATKLRAVAPRVRGGAMPLVAPSKLSAAMASGAVDFALDGQDTAPPDLQSNLLRRERFVAVVRRDHPKVGASLTLEMYCALEHAIVSPTKVRFAGRVDGALSALGRRRQVVASFTHFSALVALLRASDLIATVPESALTPFANELRLLPLPFAMVDLPMALLWHPRTHANPAHRFLRAIFAEVAAEGPARRLAARDGG